MDSWSSTREVEKPKPPKKVATIEVWSNPTTMHSEPGTYRAQFVGTNFVGYGNTITAAVADMFDRALGDLFARAVVISTAADRAAQGKG